MQTGFLMKRIVFWSIQKLYFGFLINSRELKRWIIVTEPPIMIQYHGSREMLVLRELMTIKEWFMQYSTL